MVGLIGGFVAMFVALLMLARAGVFEWGFPLTMFAMAPAILVGGLLMGLHEEPPPWRRRHGAR